MLNFTLGTADTAACQLAFGKQLYAKLCNLNDVRFSKLNILYSK